MKPGGMCGKREWADEEGFVYISSSGPGCKYFLTTSFKNAFVRSVVLFIFFVFISMRFQIRSLASGFKGLTIPARGHASGSAPVTALMQAPRARTSSSLTLCTHFALLYNPRVPLLCAHSLPCGPGQRDGLDSSSDDFPMTVASAFITEVLMSISRKEKKRNTSNRIKLSHSTGPRHQEQGSVAPFFPPLTKIRGPTVPARANFFYWRGFACRNRWWRKDALMQVAAGS